MNEERSFERFVADNVAAGSGSLLLPDDFYDDMHSFATTTRQRPEWLALIKEPPMRTNSHLVVGSPTVRVAAVVAATLLLITAMAAVGIGAQGLLAADTEIIVDQAGGGDFDTIADAVASAGDGDTILVRPGTYVESVAIDKDITVRGDGPKAEIVVTAPADGPTYVTSLDAGSEPYSFLLTDNSATLSGLTIRGDDSAVIASGGSPSIEGNVLDAVNEPFDGLDFTLGGNSLVATDGSTASFLDNGVVASGEVAVFGGANPTIRGNRLVDGPHIFLHDAGVGTVVADNVIEGSVLRGIAVSSPGAILIEGNRISDASEVGIRVGRNEGAEGYEAVIRGNTIDGTGTGIVVTEGGAPTIENNTISAIGSGITMGIDSVGNISGNTLTNNAVGVNLGRSSPVMADNTIEGGRIGISITGGSAELSGNAVEGVSNRGIAIGGEAQTVLSGNRSCENGENLWIAENADPVIDESNEICNA